MKTSKLIIAAKWIFNLLLIAGLLSGSAAILKPVSASPAAGESDPPVDLTEYWTVERMRSAIPYDVIPAEAWVEAAPGEYASLDDGEPGWAPSRAPDGSNLPVVDGEAGTYPAPAPTLDNITDYVAAGDRNTFPYSASGKVFFVMGGRNFVCSASVIGENTIWTAGHCVTNGRGTFHNNWVYVPAFSNYATIFPTPWLPTYIVTPMEFSRNMDLGRDYAIVGVRAVHSVSSQTIRQLTGALGFAWNMPREQKWMMLGYPLVLFNGLELVYSDSTYYEDNPAYSPASICAGSRIKSGGSGGPWILNEMTGAAGQANYVNGVNSYISLAPGVDEICSPYIDGRAKQLWDCAQNTANEMGPKCFDTGATANLVVTITPSKALLQPGEPYSFDIQIHNTGPFAATNLVLTVNGPLGMKSFDLPGGTCTIVGQQATCSVETLASGDSLYGTLEATAENGAGMDENSSARLTYDQQGMWDYIVYGFAHIVCESRITVTSAEDSGAGSLRQAITDVCSAGTIDFAPDLSGATIPLASQLNVGKTLTIDGSALPQPITLSGDTDGDGTGDTRVLYNYIALTLDSLVITKGNADAGNGGGIWNDGDLTLNSCTLSDNSAAIGGAIDAQTDFVDLTITNSTFTNNSASYGGAMAADGNSILMVSNSTFSGNSASYGGGLYFGGGIQATLVNDTFSGNSATNAGGGISLDIGTFTIPPSLNYTNTIIANSPSGGDCANNGGVIGTNSHNLVEDGSCSATLSGDPLLGALANNGGPTQTLALLTGSPAIDAGDDATCAAAPVNGLDQRGFSRLVGAHCDIGAFEWMNRTWLPLLLPSP
jgi:hypothetical protein